MKFSAHLLLALTLCLLNMSFASAQVNGPGPSDPGLFDTVINLPGDPVFGDTLADIQSIGNENGSADPSTQINVADGGVVSIQPNFDAFSGVEFNITGGTVNGGILNTRSGSELNISGGNIDTLLQAGLGSRVTISGGSVMRLNSNFFEGNAELIGGEFLLNGAAVNDSTVTVLAEDVLTGTLEDGTAFAYSRQSFDNLTNVTLTQSALLAAADLTQQFIDTDISTSGGRGLRAGQELTLQNGGALGTNFPVVDAILNIEGGIVLGSLKIARSTVNMSGGNVGTTESRLSADFDVFSGSTVNISGGNFPGGSSRGFFRAHTGSNVNISGGNIGYPLASRFNANSGSTVNISGGDFRGASTFNGFDANSGSTVIISGGSFNRDFNAFAGSNVELVGGEFLLNGGAFTGAAITLSTDDVFTGTLVDGSPFIFSPLESDELTDVTLTQSTLLAAADLTPQFVNTNISRTPPSGLRAGQELTLQNGGVLGTNFEVVDAILNIDGGEVGIVLESVRSTVNISGGNVGQAFNAFLGSEVNISGGVVGGFFDARAGSEVNISGGAVGLGFDAFSGSVINIRGGAIETGFHARDGSVVNVIGDNFLLDGVPVAGLGLGQVLEIENRDVTLSGVLADGTAFSFDLNSVDNNSDDFFDENATLTVSLESPFLLGDVNRDGVVDFFDIQPFINVLSTQTFQAEADIDESGVVNFFDIAPFIEILSGP